MKQRSQKPSAKKVLSDVVDALGDDLRDGETCAAAIDRIRQQRTQAQVDAAALHETQSSWVRCAVGCLQILGDRGIKCKGPGMEHAFNALGAAYDEQKAKADGVDRVGNALAEELHQGEPIWEAVKRVRSETQSWREAAQVFIDAFDPFKQVASPVLLQFTAGAVKRANADLRERSNALGREIDELHKGWDECRGALSQACQDRDAIRRAHEQDVKDAAGALMLPIPEPGSDMAKMMSANRLLIAERDRNLRLYVDASQTLRKLRESCRELLDLALSDAWELKHTEAFQRLQKPLAESIGDKFASHLASQIETKSPEDTE